MKSEKRMGLNSIFTIECKKCDKVTIVPTGKIHNTDNSHQHADVNTKAVLGTLHAGMGCPALNNLLACMNVPTISTDLSKRYEREIGPALEQCTKESCRSAAEEEKQLEIFQRSPLN
ncbi:uncharacterized protein LOC135163636 [Diachasmimorpha longicaudata]|uniref:uncharacterized protein LOC135163636 n=1 Tax=Diachasmimorpha longicaudata TaxID=58733 RepID=UPI0030B8D4AB